MKRKRDFMWHDAALEVPPEGALTVIIVFRYKYDMKHDNNLRFNFGYACYNNGWQMIREYPTGPNLEKEYIEILCWIDNFEYIPSIHKKIMKEIDYPNGIKII